MKKSLKYLMLSFACIFLFSSCNNDDDEGDNEMQSSFDGIDFTITEGFIVDYGPVNYVTGGDPTHYNYDFVLIDGTFDFQNETGNVSFSIYVEALSPGTGSFEDGTFEFIDDEDIADDEDVAGEYYFSYGEIYVDGNDNGTLFETSEDEEMDMVYVVTSGSVVIKNNGNNNFTLTYDWILQEVDNQTFELKNTEKPFSFSTTQTFEIEDDTDSEAGRKISNNRLGAKNKRYKR